MDAIARVNVVGLGLLLLCGFALLVAVETWWTVWRLRNPPRRTSIGAALRGRPGDPGELRPSRVFDAWSIEWRGASLPVWDVPGERADGPVVVLTPGWGDSRVGGMARLPALAPVASRVILWDPPGLGEAEKRAGKFPLGTREHGALSALVDRLREDPSVREAGVALYGWSAGAGTSIVCAAGAPEEVIGVIAEAPYRLARTPAFAVLRNSGHPWRLNGPIAFALLGWRLGVGARWKGFDRAEHAARLRRPLLVLHGTHDATCPVEDGRAIAEAAGRAGARVELAEIEGGGHNDLWTDPAFAEASGRAVRRFLEGIGATSARRSGSPGP